MSYRKFNGDYLFTGTKMLDSREVLITDEQGIVVGIVPPEEAGEGVEKLEGIITPGFINCHCHLELSHMKGAIAEHTGLVNFVLAILQLRNSSEEEILVAMQLAEEEMIKSGIVAVGDISNNAISLVQKLKHRLYYQNFIEVSGFSPAIADMRFQTGLAVYNQFNIHFPTQTSLVPHAPYSVSKELFSLIDGMAGNRLSSIHNQETRDENLFYLSGEGDFNRLYEALGVDVKSFHQPSGKTSLQSVLPLISNPEKLLLVHDTFTAQEDINYLQSLSSTQKHIFCLCVNANLYIENLLPPIDLLMANNADIVLGTDSLASNHQLSILSEIQTITQHFPHIPLESILQWATLNGANTLGIQQRFGSFEAGKQPGIININAINEVGNITPDSQSKVIL